MILLGRGKEAANGFGMVVLALALAACQPSAPAPTPEEPPTTAEADPCASATGFRRAIVCQTPALAALDDSVRERLVAEAASLPAEASAALNLEQDQWLEATRISCGLPSADTMPDEAQLACITSALRERANTVTGAVEQAGPFTIRRVENIGADAVTASVAAASGLGDDAPAAITRQISYPQIAGDTPAVRRFNALVRQEPRFGIEDQTSETVNYTIAYAGDDLISVRFDILDEPLAAAHGSVETRAVTFNMRTGAPLSDADVFRPGSGWENFLTRRAIVALTRAFQGTDFVPSEPDVRETVTKPPQWLVTEQALVILFPPYSFAGPQIDGGQDISIPWADLRPYLNPRGPRPIGAAPAP